MSVRRLAPKEQQPESFAFTAQNLAWAKREITKYPQGRQASAAIAILWRAQEQNEGWVSEAAIRAVADLLEMPYIRMLEIATFYTMFQLQPVGKKAHVQVCGTTPCRLPPSARRSPGPGGFQTSGWRPRRSIPAPSCRNLRPARCPIAPPIARTASCGWPAAYPRRSRTGPRR